MEISYLREFIVFSKSLNYAQSATELYVSQPTLRAHLKALGDELGAPLVCKRDGHICLTPVGKVFLQKAREILDFCETSFQECKAYSEGTTSIMMSNLSNPNFDELVKEAKDTYHDMYPEKHIDIGLSSGMFSNIESLQKHAVDMSLFAYVRKDQKSEQPENPEFPVGIESIYYKPSEVNFWVDKSSALSEKNSITFEDLEGFTLLLGNSGNMIRTGAIIRDLFEQNKVSIYVNNCPFSSYYEYLISGSSHSFGIAYADSVAHRTGLRLFRIEGHPLLSDLFVLYNAEELSVESVAFFEILKNIIRGKAQA